MASLLRTMRLVSASFAMAALTLAAPGSACDLDGLPGMHRYNPFVRYPTGPAVEPDQRSPQKVPADSRKPAPRSDRDKPEAEREEQREPKAWENDSGNSPISFEDKTVFK
jgi:hypothetical protein